MFVRVVNGVQVDLLLLLPAAACPLFYGPFNANTDSYCADVAINASCCAKLIGSKCAHASRNMGKMVKSPAVHKPVTSCDRAKLTAVWISAAVSKGTYQVVCVRG